MQQFSVGFRRGIHIICMNTGPLDMNAEYSKSLMLWRQNLNNRKSPLTHSAAFGRKPGFIPPSLFHDVANYRRGVEAVIKPLTLSLTLSLSFQRNQKSQRSQATGLTRHVLYVE